MLKTHEIGFVGQISCTLFTAPLWRLENENGPLRAIIQLDAPPLLPLLEFQSQTT